eukprot:3834063-Ditylum_brightwellii.AAC.1
MELSLHDCITYCTIGFEQIDQAHYTLIEYKDTYVQQVLYKSYTMAGSDKKVQWCNAVQNH